jgi:hypothetical protein
MTHLCLGTYILLKMKLRKYFECFVNLLQLFYIRLLTMCLLLKYFITVPSVQLKHLFERTNEMCL